MPSLTIPDNALLVDAHVHIRDPKGLADIAAAGVVAVRDAGSAADREGRIREALRASRRPRVVASGRALSKQGGYGAHLGVAVETREDISAEISRLARAGAGIIKVIASGIVSLARPGAVTRGGFTEDELVFIAAEAARHGLPVMAHANGEEAIMAAARAGVRSIEHGFFMTERALDVLAGRRVFWVPTTGALLRAAASEGTPTEAGEYVPGLVKRHQTLIREAHARGVGLAVGTDAVLPQGGYRGCYEEELAHFADAGIPAGEVVRIATAAGAELLGIDPS